MRGANFIMALKSMKTKILSAVMAAMVFAGIPAYAIHETTDMRDDGKESEIQKVLYGQLDSKQIY